MSKTCCCSEHADARTCFELRYYHHSPAAENSRILLDGLDPEECQCSCHQEGLCCDYCGAREDDCECQSGNYEEQSFLRAFVRTQESDIKALKQRVRIPKF